MFHPYPDLPIVTGRWPLARVRAMFVENSAQTPLAEINNGREYFRATPKVLYAKVGNSLDERRTKEI
tara:strand:- start:2700 stop:2900 length:201 start_codon:yes stop_codon:yes gene_type:complete